MHDDAQRPTPSAKTRSYGRVWRTFALIFAVLVCLCGSWIATAGLSPALSVDAFAWLAIATLLLGSGLAWPVALRVLNRDGEGDARNTMERTRSGWFMRPRRRG